MGLVSLVLGVLGLVELGERGLHVDGGLNDLGGSVGGEGIAGDGTHGSQLGQRWQDDSQVCFLWFEYLRAK